MFFVLTGELGAGKTTFSRGFGDALELDTPVSSPTFVVAREHRLAQGPIPRLVHIDAYRVGSAAELDELDIDVPGSIVLAEWSAPYASVLSESFVEMVFERPMGEGEDFESDQPRTVTFRGHGNCSEFLSRVSAALEGFDVLSD